MSNHSEKIANREGSWAEFEMENFEPLFLKKKSAHNRPDSEDSNPAPNYIGAGGVAEGKDKRAFTSLQTKEREKGEFILLKEGEENFKKRKEGEDILQNAHKKVALLEQEAYEKGFAQGEKDGLELGEKKAVKVIENIENLFIEISNLKREIIRQHEKEILELIFAIVKKILHDHVDINENTLKNIVVNALNVTAEKGEIVLKVNPEDFDFVEGLKPDFFTKFKELKSITITSDPSITKGGCLLETPYGDVDATIETQLEKIYQSLEGAKKIEN